MTKTSEKPILTCIVFGTIIGTVLHLTTGKPLLLPVSPNIWLYNWIFIGPTIGLIMGAFISLAIKHLD